MSGVLSELVAKQVSVLKVATESGYYQRALSALGEGDLAKAHALLTAENDSMYNEILVRVGAHAALHFKNAFDRVFDSARRRQFK